MTPFLPSIGLARCFLVVGAGIPLRQDDAPLKAGHRRDSNRIFRLSMAFPHANCDNTVGRARVDRSRRVLCELDQFLFVFDDLGFVFFCVGKRCLVVDFDRVCQRVFFFFFEGDTG